MKRVICAFAITTLILIMTICGNITVSNMTEKYSRKLQTVENYAKSMNKVMATNEINMLISEFKKQRHLLELFIKREYISNLSVNLEGLRAYANEETWRDLENEASKARAQINAIHHLFFSII